MAVLKQNGERSVKSLRKEKACHSHLTEWKVEKYSGGPGLFWMLI